MTKFIKTPNKTEPGPGYFIKLQLKYSGQLKYKLDCYYYFRQHTW